MNKEVPSSGKEWRQVVNRQGEPWSPCSGFLSGAGAVPAWPKWGDVRLQIREPTGNTLAKQAACENESSTIN